MLQLSVIAGDPASPGLPIAIVCGLMLLATGDLAGQETNKPMVRKDGQRVWIEGAKAVFLQHFDEQKAGGATPWAERSDTYMYLAQRRLAGSAVDYADLITIAGYGPSFAYAPGPADRRIPPRPC